MCHLTTFHRPRSNRLGVGMSPQKIVDAEAPPPWNGGGADPLETRYSPTRVSMPNLVMLR